MGDRPLTDLEFMLLLATLRAGEHAYGVEIAREMEQTGGRTVLLGAVYTTLDRLETAGLVRSSIGEPTPARGGRAKRYFRVTPAGLRAVKETQNAFVSLWRGVPELKGGRT
jgi:PadR family transcriptional regulator, regulatory protein PadR